MMVIDLSPEFHIPGNECYMGSSRGHAVQQLELSDGHVAPLGLYTGRLCKELRLKHCACLDYQHIHRLSRTQLRGIMVK